MRLVVQTGRPAAELGDMPLDVGVDLLGQHSGHDLESSGIGVAPALHKPGSQAGLLHRRRDRLAPAMNHHRTHAHRLHENHVDQQGAQHLRIFHDRAAQLDHGEASLELTDEAQCFNQNVGLADGFLVHGAALASLTFPHGG